MHRLFKTFLRFIRNPISGFIFYLLCILIFLLIPPSGIGAVSFYFALPFIMFAIIGLNLSFFSVLFSRFTMSEAKKRNHALEHGTIHFVRQKHGGNIRVGGSAEKNGFRICGVSKKSDLVEAFDELVKELRRKNTDLIISIRCGSNVTTAQGFGLILLTVSAIVLKVTQASHALIFAVLGLNVLIYALLRRSLGNWIQEKVYMSLNFSNARIHSINKVKKHRYFEVSPVYFVKTIIE